MMAEAKWLDSAPFYDDRAYRESQPKSVYLWYDNERVYDSSPFMEEVMAAAPHVKKGRHPKTQKHVRMHHGATRPPQTQQLPYTLPAQLG